MSVKDFSLYASPVKIPTHSVTGDHFVQFYESDDLLMSTISHYLESGLQMGSPVVIIATSQHIDKLKVYLAKEINEKQILFIKAEEALTRFMHNDLPDAILFHQFFDESLKPLRSQYKHLYVYGEMVNVLAEQNNLEGVLKLEKLWSELSLKYEFTLLCSYATENLDRPHYTKFFHYLCREYLLVTGEDEIEVKSLAELQRESRMLKKQLRNIMQAGDELITIANHELKNPLTAFSLQNRIIQTAANEEKTSDALIRIKNVTQSSEFQIKRMDNLLDRMIHLIDHHYRGRFLN